MHNIESGLRTDEPNDPGRRDFFNKVAILGTGMVVGLGEKTEAGETKEKLLVRQIEGLGWKGEPKDAPGIGCCESETAVTAFCMAPTREQEARQQQSFMDFVYNGYPPESTTAKGNELRPMMISFVNQELLKAGISLEEFDELAREFAEKYLTDDLKIAIETSRDLPGSTYKSQFIGNKIKVAIPEKSPFDSRGRQSIWETIIHEHNHGTQQSKSGDYLFSSQKITGPSLELPVILDGLLRIKILEEALRRRGLNPKGYKDRTITFPSGEECKLSELLILVEGFDMNEKKMPGPLLKNLAKPEAVRLLNRLMYGEENRSDVLRSQLEARGNQFDNETRDFNKRRITILHEYATMVADKEFPGSDGEVITKRREKIKSYFDEIASSFDRAKEDATAIEGEKELDEIHRRFLVALEKSDKIYEFHRHEEGDIRGVFLTKRTHTSNFLEVVKEKQPLVYKYWGECGFGPDFSAHRVFNTHIERK